VGQMPPPPVFFIPRIVILTTVLKGRINNWGDWGGKGCVHIQDLLRPILPSHYNLTPS